MTYNAIRVEGLSKRYFIDVEKDSYRTLRGALANVAGAPFRLLRSGPRRGSKREALWALRDLSFEVPNGQVLGIIGRNGAGKSTLLKILSRITDPTEGRAELRGRVGTLLEVGTGFHPELSGRENITLNGAIMGMGRKEIAAKFDEIVAFAELDRFTETPVKRYSSGMYLRLAFAVAAHLDPDILLVDEVLAVGDAEFQKKCIGKMADVASAGKTVLFISHNLPAISRLCARCLLLRDGRLVDDGAPDDIIAAYLKIAEREGHTRTWSEDRAPGAQGVKLVGLEIRAADGRPALAVSVEDELEIELSYVVAEPGLRFRCSVSLNTQGVCAFTSLEPSEMSRPKAGLYRSVLTIPAHLLAEGEYSVDAVLFSSRGVKTRLAAVRDAIAFHVADPIRGDSARGDYAESLGGVIRPRLPWRCDFQGAEQPVP